MNTQYEIHGRIFDFVIRGLKVPRYLPKSVDAKIITEQYIRCLTSVGANANEADGALTNKDITHGFTVVRKELKETYYWLRVISELYANLQPRLKPLLEENYELIKIVSTIIRKIAQR